MTNPIARLGELGIIPVVRLEDPTQGDRLAEALLAGGLPCAEITFRTAAAGEGIRRMCARSPEMLVGAGTVVTPEQAQQAVDAGARFIVSPGFDRRVVEWCLGHAMPVMPGVATPTEILMALESGLNVLKFFPAEALGGKEMLAALAAAFVGVKFVPTGGITAANAAAYLKLPMVFALGGSWLVAPKLIAGGAFDEIVRLTAEAVALVAQVRSGGGKT
ncbi:MAG: bifunctional 4-hydroxy-2-oxoglutarate aldolase/2-dehydro-3-deoxy-phosphogluconate aldolase [Chloroflexi bacterium]|nr:bifunctional 4-hydroxy-2-oxoglutarate aldolase/2-dehydro-3-deoxy-phosphogluconate aldolase [Chloroflexota bacterium]